jgi:predicted phosphodiesterase
VRIAALVMVCAAASSAAAAPKMRKGPYLQDVAPTAVTVMWELDEQVPAKLVLTGPDGEHARDVPAAHVAQMRVDGLRPATRYRYRVTVGDATWDGELATAPRVGDDVPFSFLVLGDSRDGVEQHRRVVDRASQEVPDFVLGTGDMVDDGSREDDWQQFFDIEGRLIRDNAYYPTLGNHDRQGRGRTADTYRAYFAVPDNGGDGGRYYAFSYATARVLVLDSNEYSFALTDQTAWLERELIAARQDPAVKHVFCVMHHPPYSVSLHGGDRDLRERWVPLFEKYGVTAVFSGHDHVYERAEANGLHYFVSGGAGAPLYPRRPKSNPVDEAAVKKFERTLHYLRVTVTGDRIEVTAVRADGTTIETTSWIDTPPVIAAVGSAIAVGSGSAARAAPQLPSIWGAGSGERDADSSLLWPALAGAVLLLGAAVVLVRTLRK